MSRSGWNLLPVDMLGKNSACHLQIIFEINDYFLKTLQEQYPSDTARYCDRTVDYRQQVNGRRVRMAAGGGGDASKVNGVVGLRSRG